MDRLDPARLDVAVGVCDGEVNSSPSGTGTPADEATALACALSVIRAMHSGEQPTSGTPSRSISERYAVYPGQQNMWGTHASKSRSAIAVSACPCESLGAASIVFSSRSDVKHQSPPGRTTAKWNSKLARVASSEALATICLA